MNETLFLNTMLIKKGDGPRSGPREGLIFARASSGANVLIDGVMAWMGDGGSTLTVVKGLLPNK